MNLHLAWDREVRVAVVGAGPAGCSAAVQCTRLGVAPLLLDRAGRAGGLVENAGRVENWPEQARAPSGIALAARFRAFVDRFGLQVRAAEVTAVHPDGAGWHLEGPGLAVRAQTVVLATGTRPLPLGVPGEADLVGRVVFPDLRTLLATRPGVREVVVVGSGEAACDQALSLATAGVRVVLACRGPGLKARGRLARRVTTARRVEVRVRTACMEVEATPGGAIRAWLTPNGGERVALEADALLVAVGRRSAAPDLLGDACAVGALEPQPGLYVTGDARLGGLGQVGIAVGDGLEAAARAVERVAEG